MKGGREGGKQREGCEKRKLKARVDMIGKSNLNAMGCGVYETTELIDFFIDIRNTYKLR